MGQKDEFTARSFAAALLLLGFATPSVFSQPPGPPPAISLKSVSLAQFTNADQYVRDQNALVALGKALFWDMQAGSDGRTACATCHFHAGADHRTQNQISDAINAFTPNQTLTPDQFPFHALSHPNDNRSAVLRDSSAITGSQGMFNRLFLDIVPGNASEAGKDATDAPAFRVNGVNVRQVGARNAPSVINAVFNYRNLWDGRASAIFSGLTPYGASDPGMNALVFRDGNLSPEQVHTLNSSLASQSVAPPMNDLEASYNGRTWPKFGKKMLSLNPLAKQHVAPDDSVLGPLANTSSTGLQGQNTYLTMTQNAFLPAYWSSDQLVDSGGATLAGRRAPAANTSEFTQAEFNFSLFWGLALQAYESTLISDDSPYDRFAAANPQALTSQEQSGLNVFRRNGCTICHAGAEFTSASFTAVNRAGVLARGRNGTRIDAGFFRTGVRPVSDDIGLGGVDTFGVPYSIAVQQSAAAQPAVNGLFKTPGLRNVEFTGPYFHNGGQATLGQVIDFYGRGGDFPGGGTGPSIRPLNLSPDDRAGLVAFLDGLERRPGALRACSLRPSGTVCSSGGRHYARRLRSELSVKRNRKLGRHSKRRQKRKCGSPADVRRTSSRNRRGWLPCSFIERRLRHSVMLTNSRVLDA